MVLNPGATAVPEVSLFVSAADQVTPMLEAGQYYGQQAFYPDWQNTGVARGNGQGAVLSRPEAIRLYEINLAAYHEAVRRRDRHTWFYAAANFALAGGMILAVALAASPAIGSPALAKICSFLAVFVGIPICFAWRRSLDQTREERELALETVRKLEADYALPYSPLGEKPKPDSKAEQVAISRERFLPRVLLWTYLGLVAFVWQVEILALGDSLWTKAWNYFSPGP
jgi:hypothetical protein